MKIIYAATPHPGLRNVGDHAQAICIHRWFSRHWPGRQVREFDKTAPIDAVRKAVEPGETIFIHSGGNMANRAVMSETCRREIIRALPDNKIVQLPQTISFTQEVLAQSKRIYNSHPDLTILARDPYSYALALDHFPKCKVGLFPDFVLAHQYEPPERPRGGALLCLRNDNESALTARQIKQITTAAAELAGGVTCLDTSTAGDVHDRRRELEKVLEEFAAVRIVVTDRLHGAIFSVVAKTPCVVLPTVDHKLDAAYYWFRGLPQVVFAKGRKLEKALARALDAKAEKSIDFAAQWLDKIPAFLRGDQAPTSLEHIIRNRRSYRKWTDLPVPRAVAGKIVRAGIEAPTGANAQCVRFRVVDDPRTIARIGKLKQWPPACLPPLAILVAYDYDVPGRVLYRKRAEEWLPLAYQDVAAAVQNMALAAESMGLSSCWVSLFDTPWESENPKVISALFLGYAQQWRWDRPMHKGRSVLKSKSEEYLF